MGAKMGALLHAGRNSSAFSSLAQEDAPHPHVVGLGESALSGRVQPPGEPVKVGRTAETKDDAPAFLGLHVLVSFACALGESTLPFMGSAGRGGPALPGEYWWARRPPSLR